MYDDIQKIKFGELDGKIVDLVLQEKSNLEIAGEVGYSLSSVKRRLRIIFKAYNVKTRAGLTREVLAKKEQGLKQKYE